MKFSVGDRVRVVETFDTRHSTWLGRVAPVTMVRDGAVWPYAITDETGLTEYFREAELELFEAVEEEIEHADRIAALIREIDGDHTMGAGALGEALAARGVRVHDTQKA